MVTGAFKSFRHEHHFSNTDDHTLMKDVFAFESSLGILGRLFNWLILTRYMTTLLEERNRVIKKTAEQRTSV
jgi:ligand-binding SRPBCC domain-containing protein